MDQSLINQLQGARVSVTTGWYDGNPNVVNNTTHIEMACGQNVQNVDITRLRDALRSSGVTGDVHAQESRISVVTRNLSPQQSEQSFQTIREVFRQIDPNVERLNLTQDIPKPSCPVASNGRDNGNHIG